MASSAADDERRIEAALTLMRRLPPQKLAANLGVLVEAMPHLEDELLQRVDQPLQLADDPSRGGKQFVRCDYNRDGDSYRSPWSNEYYPPVPAEDADEVYKPGGELRELEVLFNEIFEVYREQYYTGGVSSVYLWEQDSGFAGCFLVKKEVSKGAGSRHLDNGTWDAIHVVDVTTLDAASGRRKVTLTSTVLVRLIVDSAATGKVNLGGSLQRQAFKEVTAKDNDAVIEAVGTMLEAMETALRSSLHDIYIGKTREILGNVRSAEGGPQVTRTFLADLQTSVAREGARRTVDSEV